MPVDSFGERMGRIDISMRGREMAKHRQPDSRLEGVRKEERETFSNTEGQPK